MKPQSLLTMLSGLLVALATSVLMAVPPPSTSIPPSEEATPPSGQAPPPAGQEVGVPAKSRTAEQAAEDTSDIACRASELIGMPVTNKEGKELGSLEDLVFDPKTGTIRYAALAHGGILGIGEKRVAVPWDSFEFQVKQREQRAFRPDGQPQAERPAGVVSEDRFQLILDMDSKTLEQRPGFKKDRWPESGDESLLKKGTEPVDESPPVQPETQQGDAAGQPGGQQD